MTLDAGLYFTFKWTTKRLANSRIVNNQKYKSRLRRLRQEKAQLEQERDELHQVQSTCIGDLTTSLHSAKSLVSRLEHRIGELEDKRADYTFSQQQKPYFDFIAYLAFTPQPETHSLRKLRYILEGRTGIQDIFKRVSEFANVLATMPSPASLKDIKYVAYLRDGIIKAADHDVLAVGYSSQRKRLVEDTINLARDYTLSTHTNSA